MSDHSAEGEIELDDELIARLVSDGGQADINALGGVFVASGATSDSVRVYTTLQLDEFLEIPRDKVLGIKRFPSGALVVWVPADLRVRLIKSDTLGGDFLKGHIQARASSRSLGSSSLGRMLARVGVGGGGTSWGGCPTDFPDPSRPDCGLTQVGCPDPTTGCSC